MFIGWIGDDTLHSLYRIADLCVVPSIYEPFGLVALEAMASGCPCIVADTGGLREVVPDDGTSACASAPATPRSLGRMIEQRAHRRRAARPTGRGGPRARAQLRLGRRRDRDREGLRPAGCNSGCKSRLTRNFPGTPCSGRHDPNPHPQGQGVPCHPSLLLAFLVAPFAMAADGSTFRPGDVPRSPTSPRCWATAPPTLRSSPTCARVTAAPRVTAADRALRMVLPAVEELAGGGSFRFQSLGSLLGGRIEVNPPAGRRA